MMTYSKEMDMGKKENKQSNTRKQINTSNIESLGAKELDLVPEIKKK